MDSDNLNRVDSYNLKLIVTVMLDLYSVELYCAGGTLLRWGILYLLGILVISGSDSNLLWDNISMLQGF